MAQNITILGASYSNVPAVTLPKTGGGTARFTDVSDSTVTESTVLAGYKAYNASGTSVTGTYAPNLQEKTVTPTIESQTITNDSNYEGLSQINLNGIPYSETENSANGKTITIAQGDSGNVNGNKILKLTPSTFTTENCTVQGTYGLWNADSDQYVTIYCNDPTVQYTVTFGNFNFSSIPTSAIITKIVYRVKTSTTSVDDSRKRLYRKADLSVGTSSSGILYVYGDATASESNIKNSFEEGHLDKEYFNIEVYSRTDYTDTPESFRLYGVDVYIEYDIPTNKVIYGENVLIDLTSDTVSTNKLAQGYTAHNASGAIITGTGKFGSAYQDLDGYVVIEEDESSAPQGTLSITANGTYDVSDYAGANVQLGGMSETDLKNFIQRSYNFKNIEWPDALTDIGEYAFASCTNFNPSSFPSGLLHIGQYAFYGCSRLSLTKLPDTLTGSIPYYAFTSCVNLALTELPSGITAIAGYAFQHCHNLAITELPSGVTTINVSAFQYCNNITSISCEGAITMLSNSAFTGSSTYPMSLTSASFPNMVLSSNIGTVFGHNTSANACQLLEFCDIGFTVGIAANAFANCYALETLVLRKTASVCTLEYVSAFTNTPMSGYNNKTGTVYVPSALISSYQTATNWSTLYSNGTVTFSAIEGSKYERN